MQHLTVDRIILGKFTEEKVFLGAVRKLNDDSMLHSSNRIHFRIENVREARALFRFTLAIGVDIGKMSSANFAATTLQRIKK